MLYSSLRIASATLRWTTSLYHPTRARSHLPGKKSHWAHLVQRFSMCWRQTRGTWFPDIHCCDPCLGRYLRLHTSTHAYIVCGSGSVYRVERFGCAFDPVHRAGPANDVCGSGSVYRVESASKAFEV